jgi:exodeoxyribonuclease VII large subunit
LHDVVTALQRRVPHIPVVLAAASVQGENAPRELAQALSNLYTLSEGLGDGQAVHIDVILLVRGGGALEDLWAFNDETLARMIFRSSVPVVSGVGHETDFTIADFVADMRAPTPTAAAEMVSEPVTSLLAVVAAMEERMADAAMRVLERQGQRIDLAAARMGRPSALAHRQRLKLSAMQQRLEHGARMALQLFHSDVEHRSQSWLDRVHRVVQGQQERCQRAELRLGLLDPTLVLRRGYAWLTLENGHTLSSVAQAKAGAHVRASLADGALDLTVTSEGSD